MNSIVSVSRIDKNEGGSEGEAVSLRQDTPSAYVPTLEACDNDLGTCHSWIQSHALIIFHKHTRVPSAVPQSFTENGVQCYLFWRTSVPGHPTCRSFMAPVNNLILMEYLVATGASPVKYHWDMFKHQNELALELLKILQ